MNAKEYITSLFERAGIQVNGSEPWDIQISDNSVYQRLVLDGSMALGETYMEDGWDCARIDMFIERALRAHISAHKSFSWSTLWMYVKARLSDANSLHNAIKVAEVHYDIGNDLFKAMLDPENTELMVYTCGYWKDARTLREAQEAKLDLVCQKLDLRPGQTVLDIGCGWGSFAKFAAERYGVEVVGLTISKEQADLAVQLCEGLPVDIRLQDYRELCGGLREQYDHIVSLGMFEHVGLKHYREYFVRARVSLKTGGLFLLHTIGCNTSIKTTDPWIDTYIFPGGKIPSLRQIAEAHEGLFIAEDVHNFGPDYDKTLMAWHENFERAWEELRHNPLYNRRFYRKWRYYLLSCAAAFRARELQLWQIVLSKGDLEKTYRRVS